MSRSIIPDVPPAQDFNAWLASLSDRQVMALTLWAEARGEGRLGREKVANCIMNRVNIDLGNDGKPDWWGEGVKAVCLKPWQFSCWNENDPNRGQMRKVTEADPVYAECLEIADRAMAGELPDTTNGATHYLNPKTVLASVGKLPTWATHEHVADDYGRHTFFRVL